MKRKSFRIHLSTAIVMMFVAGVLIFISTLPNIPFQYVHGYWKIENAKYYGWPISFAWDAPTEPVRIDNSIGLMIDVFLLGILTILVGCWCEAQIQKREIRKDGSS